AEFVFTNTPPTVPSPLSLHDALPIWWAFWRTAASYSSFSIWYGPHIDTRCSSLCTSRRVSSSPKFRPHSGSRTWTCTSPVTGSRSEEHTSELQSRFDLVCRLLLEKKK